MLLKHFTISGRVQGVGFRHATRQAAAQIGVSGWVQNLPSGEVAVVASGDEQQLAALEKWLWLGPAAAQVIGVAVGDCNSDIVGDIPANFEIRV